LLREAEDLLSQLEADDWLRQLEEDETRKLLKKAASKKKSKRKAAIGEDGNGVPTEGEQATTAPMPSEGIAANCGNHDASSGGQRDDDGDDREEWNDADCLRRRARAWLVFDFMLAAIPLWVVSLLFGWVEFQWIHLLYFATAALAALIWALGCPCTCGEVSQDDSDGEEAAALAQQERDKVEAERRAEARNKKVMRKKKEADSSENGAAVGVLLITKRSEHALC
jgi:hypothetical protein